MNVPLTRYRRSGQGSKKWLSTLVSKSMCVSKWTLFGSWAMSACSRRRNRAWAQQGNRGKTTPTKSNPRVYHRAGADIGGWTPAAHRQGPQRENKCKGWSRTAPALDGTFSEQSTNINTVSHEQQNSGPCMHESRFCFVVSRCQLHLASPLLFCCF